MAYGFGTTFGTGTTDRITNALQPNAGNRSYFIRAYRNGPGGGNLGRFFEAHDGADNELFDWNTGNNRLDIYRPYSGAPSANWYAAPPSSAAWHSYAITKNWGNTTAPVIYIDGSSVAVTTIVAASGTVNAVTANYVIGNRGTDNARGWDGKLCEFYVWDAILTSGEIADLHNGVDPTTIQTASLVIAMPMVSNATDSKGNATSVTGALVVPGWSGNANAGTGTSTGTGSGGSATGLAGGSDGSASGGTGTSTGTGSGGVATGLFATTTIASPSDRGNIKLSTSSVTSSDTATPTVNLELRTQVNEYGSDPVAKAYFFYGQVGEVSGKTPSFKVKTWSSTTHNDSTEILKFLNVNPFTPGTYKPVWSYDARTWSYFDNCSWDADNLNLNFSNNSAFNQSTVYVATAFPWQESKTAEWIASLSSGYLSETPSAIAYGGDAYQFGVTSTRSNELSESIAACKLYALKISSGASNAPDGSPKRKVVLFSGVHSGEDVGSWVLKGAVEFLLTEDAKAVTHRAWFDTYVYPMVQPSGRRGGHWRSDFDPAKLTADSNRYWNASTLATINAHKSAVATDTGNNFIAAFDFHAGHVGVAYSNMHSNANVTTWTNAIRVYRPGMTINANNVPGSTATWAAADMGAALGITPEYNWGYTNTTDHAELFGADQMRALSDVSATMFGPDATAASGLGESTGSGSGGAAVAGYVDAFVESGVGTSIGAGSGGVATGVTIVSGDALGGTGTSTGSGSGGEASGSSTLTLTPADINAIVNAVITALQATTIPVDTKKMNGATVLGTGIESDKWRGNV